MKAFEFNKLVGAILLTVLSIEVIDLVGDALVSPEREQLAAVDLGERGAEQPPAQEQPEQEPEEVEPIAPLLASASAEEGSRVARKCQACHTLDKGGANKVGPNLWNMVMADKASDPDFSYSSSLQEAGGKWTYEDLNEFLHDPRESIPGTRMVFAGLKDREDRAAIIAYLRTLSDNPPPLPEAGS